MGECILWPLSSLVPDCVFQGQVDGSKELIRRCQPGLHSTVIRVVTVLKYVMLAIQPVP